MLSSEELGRVSTLIDERHYDEAIAQATAYVQAGKGGYAHALLARAHLEAGHQDELRKVLPIAIQQAPSLDWLRRFLAEDLLAQKRYPEALQAIHQALWLAPSSAVNYCYEAQILREWGHPAEAVAAATDALSVDRGHVEAHVELGRAYHALGHLPEAEKVLRIALDTSERKVPLLHALGDVFLATGRPGDAAFAHRLAERRLGRGKAQAGNAPLWGNLLVIGAVFLLCAAMVRGNGSVLGGLAFYAIGAGVCVFSLRLASRDPLIGHKPDSQLLAIQRQP